MPLSIAWRSDKSDGMHFGLMVSASNHTSLITIRRASQTINTSQRPEVLFVGVFGMFSRRYVVKGFTQHMELLLVVLGQPYTATGYCDMCW